MNKLISTKDKNNTIFSEPEEDSNLENVSRYETPFMSPIMSPNISIDMRENDFMLPKVPTY